MKKKSAAAAAAIIAGASFLAGILTAPKSGKETRKGILDKGVKAKIEAEKLLKKSHSELDQIIKDAEIKAKTLKADAKKELQESLEKAKVAKEKSREMLSVIRSGETDDKNLQKALNDVIKAKKNLVIFLKKR